MLDDRAFWENAQKGGIDPPAEASGTVTDLSLDPGNSAEDKPTTTDPPEERSMDLESASADTQNETENSAQASVSIPAMQLADESSADETMTDEPSADLSPVEELPVEELDDHEIMRQLLLTVRELTAEVRQLRAQVESKPYDAAHYPSERPPGSIADADGNASETQSIAQSGQKKPAKKNKALSIISNVLFYVVIAAMIFGAFLMRSTGEGKPFMIAGFSAANVLTSSMEDVYPKGSLIITKQVDASELRVGDDITFMVSEDSSITHRIIEITENYQETGERAFQTQGTMNSKPDKEMVAVSNVVGKVVFHSKPLGDFANFVKANWPILIFVLIVLIGLIAFLKWNAKRTYDENNSSEGTPPPKKESHKKRRLRKSEEEVE